MQRFDDDPDNIYVLARVVFVGQGREDVRFFPNPWNHGDLVFGQQKPDGYYPVSIRAWGQGWNPGLG